jgi:hypothetical protein
MMRLYQLFLILVFLFRQTIQSDTKTTVAYHKMVPWWNEMIDLHREFSSSRIHVLADQSYLFLFHVFTLYI